MADRLPAAMEERVSEQLYRMRPVFDALPKSEEGFLEASAVRYLLHRYFIERHGWFVPVTGRDDVADERLPYLLLQRSDLATKFKTRLAKRGLSLLETAALAAAVESMTRTETADRLHAAFRLSGVPPGKQVGESEVEEIMKVYLAIYKMGLDHNLITEQDIATVMQDVYSPIPNWDEMVAWSRKVRSEILADAPEQVHAFQNLIRVVETIQDRYAHWSDAECLSVKQGLKQYAKPGTGRVPLDAFYSASLPNGWATVESVERLRQMGALDERDPSNPSVVVPNYFDIPDTCEDPSKYYSVCCISECEALMRHLEHELGSPNAHPSSIIEIVQKLPSAAVEAPRVLPTLLVQRLGSIAAGHGGYARLHSRLFRQWMHHAYPSECSFPVEANETTVEVPGPALASPSVGVSEDIPWSESDEDYITCRAPSKESERPASGLRMEAEGPRSGLLGRVGLLFVAGGLAWMLAQEMRALWRKRGVAKGGLKRYL